MKRLLTIVLFCTILNTVYSQTISPINTGEFCPNVEYTFTASIPKTYQSMIGISSASVTQLPASPVGSTFTFKGKFGDANQKQSFRVNYTDGTSYDFEFKKIKSLFYGSSCTPIQPNQTTITAPICQVSNFNISFNNIQWNTAFETPSLCFGSITTYEYQLPNGWKIGTNMSDGTNWIPGGNNVTVTSDLSTGNGMTIKVRPANNCGTGLTNGQTPAQINILRPKPTLTFTGNTTICVRENFQAYNIPSWVTGLTWNVTPTTVASIGNPYTNPVTVQKVSNGLAELRLTINSAQCGSYEYYVGKIAAGIVVPTIQYVTYYGTDVGLGALIIPYATYNWYEAGVLTEQGGGSTYQTSVPCNTSKLISVAAVNVCGTSTKANRGVSVKCSIGGTYSLAPNPASSNLTITAKVPADKMNSTTTAEIQEVRITDKFGNLKTSKKYPKGTKSVSINTTSLKQDVYIVQIFNGKEWNNQQLIVEH